MSVCGKTDLYSWVGCGRERGGSGGEELVGRAAPRAMVAPLSAASVSSGCPPTAMPRPAFGRLASLQGFFPSKCPSLGLGLKKAKSFP